MARTKAGRWLTTQDLRSGLREQFATESKGATIVVELRWVKHHVPHFIVSTTVNGTRRSTASFALLGEARNAFTSARDRAHHLEGESA